MAISTSPKLVRVMLSAAWQASGLVGSALATPQQKADVSTLISVDVAAVQQEDMQMRKHAAMEKKRYEAAIAVQVSTSNFVVPWLSAAQRYVDLLMHTAHLLLRPSTHSDMQVSVAEHLPKHMGYQTLGCVLMLAWSIFCKDAGLQGY